MKAKQILFILLAALLFGGCAYRPELPVTEQTVTLSEGGQENGQSAAAQTAEPELSPEPTAAVTPKPTPSPTPEPTATPTPTPTPEPTPTPIPQTDWAASLEAAQENTQLLTVEAIWSSATVTLHEKGEDGIWRELLVTSAKLGKNGIGKMVEGDRMTPVGTYHFLFAFGRNMNPGTAFPYTQIDRSWYWVDDSSSVWYNQFVSTKNVKKDWTVTAPLYNGGYAFNYALALDYNKECVPGLGSAIALHCDDGQLTYGCIAVPEEDMVSILQLIHTDCTVLIDTPENLRAAY